MQLSFVQDRMNLKGRTVVVTGGGRNLGLMMARGLAGVGAAVVIAERDRDSGSAAAAEINSAGGRALWVETDVKISESIEAMLDVADREMGPVTILVNNAGGMFKGAALEIPEKGFSAVLKLNLVGNWLCAQALARRLVAAGKPGSIVNISSTNAIVGQPNGPHYAAAKAGILGLTRALAAEWATHGIRVNAIAPGSRRRPSTLAPTGPARAGGDIEYQENIAAAVVFLASDMSTWVTGHTLVVDDGGTTTTAEPRPHQTAAAV